MNKSKEKITRHKQMALAYSLASFTGLIQDIALSDYLFDNDREKRLKEQEESVCRYTEDMKSWKENTEDADKPDLDDYTHKMNDGGKVILTGMFGMIIGFLMSTIATR